MAATVTLTEEQLAALIGAAVKTALAESRPAKAEAASPLVDAPAGERMKATRAYNLEHKVAGKFCETCAKGFVYAKTDHASGHKPAK